MRIKLWQRIFCYTIIVLLFSHAVGFFTFRFFFHGDLIDQFAERTNNIAVLLQGQSYNDALVHARAFSRADLSVWILDNTRFAEHPELPEAIRNTVPGKRWERAAITLFENEKDEPKLWAQTPLSFKDGERIMVVAFQPPPKQFRNVMLFQIMIPMFTAGGTLALWMAWRVSRPLRKLHDEVREMSAIGPGLKVSVIGRDEIADVATAVNMLTESLGSHMHAMRELLANVSHELRSPLARANIALGIIQESLPPEYTPEHALYATPEGGSSKSKTATTARYLLSLQEELNHMDTLIGTTLLTRKLEAQQEIVLTGSVNFSTLCLDTCGRYRTLFTKNGLTFKTDIAPDIMIRGNRVLLMQLLANLLDNCLKYTDPRGEVSLSLFTRKNNAHLCVENTCKNGNTTDNVDRIFDAYVQGAPQEATGVGLGLALVKKTVELHGGEIMAVTTDVGLCVCVCIPLEDFRSSLGAMPQ